MCVQNINSRMATDSSAGSTGTGGCRGDDTARVPDLLRFGAISLQSAGRQPPVELFHLDKWGAPLRKGERNSVITGGYRAALRVRGV